MNRASSLLFDEVFATTDAGRLALAQYGCELGIEGNVPCTGAPRPFRVLAALAGIPEQNVPMPDEDDE